MEAGGGVAGGEGRLLDMLAAMGGGLVLYIKRKGAGSQVISETGVSLELRATEPP